MNRMNREQFFAAMAGLDEDRLRKALWNLYWRGTATVRERIETELTPVAARPRTRATEAAADPDAVLAEVREFVSLARSGAYMAGDRRVHRTERSRWRLTFRRLFADSRKALRAQDITPGVTALSTLIDLACVMGDYDYFHSDDPVEAAKIVISDEVALLWGRIRDHEGFPAFAEAAATQLVRWESRYGWTRRGFGSVSQKETSLAEVLAGMLTVPDAWTTVATWYLTALDQVVPVTTSRSRNTTSRVHDRRTESLTAWNLLLLDQFADTEDAGILDRIATHPALGGPELTYFQAALAHRRGDTPRARALIHDALSVLPGHPGFHDLARAIDAPLPDDARRVVRDRGWGTPDPQEATGLPG